MNFNFNKTKFSAESTDSNADEISYVEPEGPIMKILRNEIFELNQQLAFYKMPTDYSAALELIKERKEKAYLEAFSKYQKLHIGKTTWKLQQS